MDLVAIDPAARRFAYAVFHDGTLEACGYAERYDQIPIGDRSYTWVFEVPRNLTSFAVAHKDLDRLRRTLRKIRIRAIARGETVTGYKPSEWKGNLPKRVHHRRAWAILTAPEKLVLPDRPGVVSYAHDVHDAVALGLTHLGRMKRGRTRARS